MAVTRLGKGAGGTGTTTATWTGFNIVASDANTVAVVLVNWSTGTNATATCSVTYGGVAMKQLGIQLGGATTSRSGCGIYYLFNPGTGAKTIVVTPAVVTPAQVRGIDVAFSGVSSIGMPQNVATMAHTVMSNVNGYTLRVLSNGVTTGTLNQTTELAAGAAVTGIGDFIAVQSVAGASPTVAFTASGTATTPVSTACTLTSAGDMSMVQIASSTAAAGASRPILMPGPTKVGNTIIACMQANPGANALTTVTDTAGNTYSQACPLTRVATNNVTWVYYAPVTVASDAGANTVTASFAGSQTNLEIIAVEYDGLAAAPFDQHMEATGTGTAMNSGNTPTTTQADELVFGFGSTGLAVSAAGAGYTGRIVGTDSSGSIVEDKVVTSTGVQAAAATTASSTWVMNVATFKKAVAAAPVLRVVRRQLSVAVQHAAFW